MGKAKDNKLADGEILTPKNVRGKWANEGDSRSKIQSKIDNLGKSTEDIVDYYNHPSKLNLPNALERTVTIPFVSNRMNNDSIYYDITLGFIFAAIFTFTVALLGIFFNWCCVCVFCPKLHRKRMRRRRIRERRKWIVREQLFSAGIQMTPLTKVQEYAEVPADDDGDSAKKEDEDRDQSTRMEYGQVDDNEAYDDDDDYLLSSGGDNKSVGRYEEKDIEASANKYFGDDDKNGNSQNGSKSNNRSKGGDDESVSSDSSNEACEPLLDLAAIELDMAMMEKCAW